MTATLGATQESDNQNRGLSRHRIAQLLIVTLILIGAVLRIGRWVHFRSLWLDEIYLAHSVVGRSMHDLLLKPLSDWQAAPAGFLALVHVCVAFFGSGERSLRLVSLVFGLASLPLMLAVSRRFLGSIGIVIAMASFSFLGPLIYYSNELKPYACDVVVSLAITLSVLRWMDDPSFSRGAVAAIVGAIGVFFSFPAVFVLAGAGIWMLAQERVRKRKVLLIGAMWAAAFAVDYLIFLRPFTSGEAHPHLVQYWVAQNAFMPHRPIDAVRWIFSNLAALARDPGCMWLDYPDAALVGLLIGAAVAIHHRGKLLLLLAPLPIVLIASLLKQYPFGDRLAIFFVPQYLLLIAAGAEMLWTNFAGKAAVIAITGCIIIPSADRAIGYLFYPPGREESLAAYRWVASRYQRGDLVYLTHFAEPSFHYYEAVSNWPEDLEKADALHIQPENLQAWQIIEDVRALAGRRRVWVIVIHAEGGEFSAEQVTLAGFNEIGHCLMEHNEPGAKAYLYDCQNGNVDNGSRHNPVRHTV
jgi:hypothetical protein